MLPRPAPVRAMTLVSLAAAALAALLLSPSRGRALRADSLGGLRSPESFASIADRQQRSGALFLEASRVMLHSRCVNCHPNGDSPTQGDERRVHDPPVSRGDDDRGIAGMRCDTCHQDHNLELARVPGAPKWHLAPREMFWAGRTPASLCEQLKDSKRNGGRTLAQIVDHSAHDELVGWGWSPGPTREPAPGTQARFGALMQAWAESGAACPAPENNGEQRGPAGSGSGGEEGGDKK